MVPPARLPKQQPFRGASSHHFARLSLGTKARQPAAQVLPGSLGNSVLGRPGEELQRGGPGAPHSRV